MMTSTRRWMRCQMGRMASSLFESPEGGFYFGELHVLTPESVGVRSTSGSESACRLNQITNC